MILFVFLIGLCVGSFVNVLADRLPRGESVLFGRSHCDYCKRPLRWYELVPLVSYMVSRGRCLRCHKALSLQYPIVELFVGVFFALIYAYHGTDILQFVTLLTFGSALITLFIADLKYMILPDSMIILALVGAGGYLYSIQTPFSSLLSHFVSAVGAFIFFYLIWRATRGRGMGFGDVKFSWVMGFFLGYPLTVIALYIAFLTGAAAGVILMIGGRVGWKSHIAFGPFLIAGLIGAFIWQQHLIALWSMFL